MDVMRPVSASSLRWRQEQETIESGAFDTGERARPRSHRNAPATGLPVDETTSPALVTEQLTSIDNRFFRWRIIDLALRGNAPAERQRTAYWSCSQALDPRPRLLVHRLPHCGRCARGSHGSRPRKVGECGVRALSRARPAISRSGREGYGRLGAASAWLRMCL